MTEFEEVINDNGHILFWQPENQYRLNSTRILGMDLDWTFIKPIKGKIHPIDENDWEFLTMDLSRIKSKIEEGYKFVIFTNQGGLLNLTTGKLGIEGFKNRWNAIYTKLQNEHGINSVYLVASLYDDFNRKPFAGMWEYIETVLNGNIKVDRTTSLYVGDMAGRKGDYSSSDLLFAMNLGVNFQVPEVFYNMPNGKAVSNRTSVLMKAVEKNEKVFNGRIFIDEFDKTISQKNKLILEDIKKLLLERQCLIMFVGSPASGKTSYYQENIKNIENQIYLSNDTFNGTPGKFNKEIEKTLRNSISVVIDNTNGTSKVREKYIKIARDINKESGKDIKIIVVKFNTEKEIVLHLNAIRTKLINTCILKGNKDCKHNVPAVAIHSYWKRLEEPNKKEDIDYIFEIEYEPIFNVDGKSGITHKMFIQYI
jgi:bifunctional polynucleotide phosphatase/kinase